MTATVEVSLLEQHPLSAAFPSMPENEIAALALDIEAHGQREPGITLDGMVLDGWHRYLACHRLGVQFKAKEYDGDDPVAFVISHNLHRRHLTATQRANAVVATSNWKPQGRPTNKPAPGAYLSENALSDKEMAAAAEVSERTIRQAKAAITADPSLGDAMKDGKVSAKEAAEVAKLPKAKREKAVKAIKEGKPPAPKKEKQPDDAKVRAELTDLQGKYADLLEKNAGLSDIARELNDKLEAFETTEPDDQQKLIAELQLKLRKKDAEIDRQRVQLRDANNKCNDLIRAMKRMQKHG